MEKQKLSTKHWEVLDYIIHEDGTKELANKASFNVVTDGLSKLIACLLKMQAGYTGILYWGLGSGNSAWPDGSPGSPSDTDIQLVSEFYRKAISTSDIIFINDNNEESNVPTNRLQVTVTFGADEANYDPSLGNRLMEFGIFCGNATSALNSGLMINHKTHPAIYKDNTMQLERIVRFTF